MWKKVRRRYRQAFIFFLVRHIAWRIFIEDTIQGKTLDESAEKLGIFHSTAWSWRHKIMDKFRSFQDDVVLSDKCELDEKYFR